MRWNKNEIKKMEMLHLLGVIYGHTAAGSGKVALRKIVKQNAKPSVAIKHNDVIKALHTSGLLIVTGDCKGRKYRWNLKEFGAPSLLVAEMMIAETEHQIRVRARRSYQMAKAKQGIVNNFLNNTLLNGEENAILEKKPRQPYKWGCKEYLADMEVGETRVDKGEFNWAGLRTVACRLHREFGSKYEFRTKQNGAYRQVTRIA